MGRILAIVITVMFLGCATEADLGRDGLIPEKNWGEQARNSSFYEAGGEEPGWWVTVNKDTEEIILEMVGEFRYVMEYRDPDIIGEMVVWRTPWKEGQWLEVRAFPVSCELVDGRVFRSRCKIVLGVDEYEGCGSFR